MGGRRPIVRASRGGTRDTIEGFGVSVANVGLIRAKPAKGERPCRWELILVIVLVIFLLGGFSGRFGGYGYGYGHGGIGVIGIILIILVVLLLMGRL